MGSTKKVSIIIPVHNSEENIARCIESCLKQTYKNIEIILIDDGSSDSSLDISKRYQKLDSGIVLIEQKNFGVSVARNNGLEKSTGDYITFGDSDDFLFRNSIEKMIKIIVRENVDIVRTNNLRVLKNGKSNPKLTPNIKNKKYCRKEIENSILNKILSGEISSHLWLLCVKSSLIKDNNIKFIPKIKVMQDKLFYIKLFSRAKNFYQSNEITYNYYCNDNSTIMSKNKCLMRIKYILEVARLCEDILDEEGLTNKLSVKKLYTSHFSSICRELYYCKPHRIAIKEVQKKSSSQNFIRMFNNVSIAELRFENKISFLLLKRKMYRTLNVFCICRATAKKILKR